MAAGSLPYPLRYTLIAFTLPKNTSPRLIYLLRYGRDKNFNPRPQSLKDNAAAAMPFCFIYSSIYNCYSK